LLDDLGIADNTIVVFTSDNGPEATTTVKHMKNGKKNAGAYFSVGSSGPYRGQKGSLLYGGVRVPFFVRWPGKIPQGLKDTSTELSSCDLLTTLCAAANIKLPEDLVTDGENNLPALLGTPQAKDRTFFWDVNAPE